MEEKKKNLIQSFYIKPNVEFWKKINILTLVLSEKKILNETKNHNPLPPSIKWSVPYVNMFSSFSYSIAILIYRTFIAVYPVLYIYYFNL